MTEVLGVGNPAGRVDRGIRTDPVIGGPWLAIRRFAFGTVAKNPATPSWGLTWTTLVALPIDSIVACRGMLNAIRGSGTGVAVPLDEVVEDVGVVEVVVDETGAVAEVTPETCCEPRSEVNAGEPNRV